MGAEVVSKDYFLNWSLTQLSFEFGVARETVARRISEQGIKDAGKRRGHPVYRVAEVARAILAPPVSPGVALNDPDLMTPKERADWYKSEIDRVKFERENGASVAVTEAREQMSVVAKTGLQVLETLPDILERDFALDAGIIAGVEAAIDGVREEWAAMLEGDI